LHKMESAGTQGQTHGPGYSARINSDQALKSLSEKAPFEAPKKVFYG
jgi:hypothetical protein